MSIESMMPSNYLILCCPLLLLPSILPSIEVFPSESALPIRWPKYWRFGFSISPSNEYLGLTSCRIDWFDLLAAQGTLQSVLQHHHLKASVLRRSAFLMVQLSQPRGRQHIPGHSSLCSQSVEPLLSVCCLPLSALSPFSLAPRLLLTDRNVKTKYISSIGCAY